MTTLGDAARLIRSKNAGPFWLTIDVFFATPADFHRAAASALTDPSLVADLYRVPADAVKVFLLDQLNAIKISFPRPVAQGALTDADLHAGQQYVPLLSIELPPTQTMDRWVHPDVSSDPSSASGRGQRR